MERRWNHPWGDGPWRSRAIGVDRNPCTPQNRSPFDLAGLQRIRCQRRGYAVAVTVLSLRAIERPIETVIKFDPDINQGEKEVCRHVDLDRTGESRHLAKKPPCSELQFKTSC